MMKVAKLVRLTKKDSEGLFVNDKDNQTTLRSRAIVSAETVKESEDNYKNTGLLYIVDKKATAERDEIVAAENEERLRKREVIDFEVLGEETNEEKAAKEAEEKAAKKSSDGKSSNL